MKLLIVESPTKSRTLGRFLDPKQYRVLSSYGHIRDLPKSELGVDVENDFKPKYIIPLKARKYLKPLKEAVKKADITILATDEDREGESISWHLIQLLDLGEQKPYERIVFHEITKSAIEKALEKPRNIDMNLVNAQQARRVLDRLVGYKLSPFLWKKVFRGLSAGRVQSVVVRLVVEREREIEKFIPQEYWSIEALLQKILNPKSEIRNKSQVPPKESLRDPTGQANSKSQTEFKALLIKKNDKIISKLGIKSKKEADEIVKDLKGTEYKVGKVEKKEVKRNPLPPFTTSTLQQEAWKRFHWSAKFTMSIAQNLYEKGLISYHRTDSLSLSDLSLFAAKKFIIENYGNNYWAGFLRHYKTKAKAAQEAHEAIRPTHSDNTPEKIKMQKKLDENQFRLYDLIWRRFIACQMSQAIFDSTSMEIEAGNPKSEIRNSKQIPKQPYGESQTSFGPAKFQIKNRYTFRATGQILKFDGFLKVYPIKHKEKEMPSLKKNELLELLKLLSSQHFTKPSPRYTEATLIKALEENGIGRPSTYAPVLSTVQGRNYVEKDEKKCLRPTETGIIVNDLLVEHFSGIVDVEFTAKIEEELDKIAAGKTVWIELLDKFYHPFEKNLKQKYEEVNKEKIVPIQKTEKTCPKCGAPLIIRLGRFGKFYACSKFPECKHTEPLPKKTLGIKCPQCQKGEITEKRTRKRKIFYACNQFPECNFALWDKPTGEKCPKCQSLLVETKRGPRYHPPSAELRDGQIHPVKSAEGEARQFNRVKCSNKECNPKN